MAELSQNNLELQLNKSPAMFKSSRFRNSKLSVSQKPTSSTLKLERQDVSPMKIINIEQEENGFNNSVETINKAPLKSSDNRKSNNSRLKSVFRSSMLNPNMAKSEKQRKKSLSTNSDEENKLESLFDALGQLSRKERFDKAVRHFRECLTLKPVRHDIECQSQFMKAIYFWQTSNAWQTFLFILGLIIPLLSFLEPTNHYDTSYTSNSELLDVEVIFLIIIGIDIIFEYYHLYFDKDKSLYESYVLNLVLSTRTIIFLILLLDCIVFHSTFPELTFRFSRFVRPFLVFYYSNELRRTLISILKSLQKITQLIIFIFFLTFFFAIIGWRFIGNLDGTSDQVAYDTDFSDLGSAANIMYSLISFDNYPDCMIPAYNSSGMFSFFFIIYCILLVLLFIPIPVSVVYEAFRIHRSKFVIMDKIEQREQLLSCFISLDFTDSKAINYDIFKEFVSKIYLQRRRFIKRIRLLYINLDQNDPTSISLNEFFEIVEVMEKNPKFQIPSFRDYEFWDKIRGFAVQKLYCKAIAKSMIFEFFMLFVLIGNCIVLFYNMSSDDQNVQDTTDSLDNYFFYMYVIEFVVKAIGLGIQKYFEDSWNVFDFSMVVMSTLSLALSTTLTFLQDAKSAKATKLLRLTKINRIFKIFKALRSIKFLNLILSGAELFYQVKLLVVKILMCLPIVIRLIPINLMLNYIYSYIALEMFNTQTFEYREGSPFESGYAAFSSFSDSLLIFFQISLEANWSSYIYDNIYKFGRPVVTRAVFISFDFINQFILLSLIKGIVWEVFTVVNEEIKIQEAEEQKRNDASFMKIDDINKLLFLRPQHLIEEASLFYKQSKFEQRGRSSQVHPVAIVGISRQITNTTSTAQTQYGTLTSDLRGIMQYEEMLKALNNPITLIRPKSNYNEDNKSKIDLIADNHESRHSESGSAHQKKMELILNGNDAPINNLRHPTPPQTSHQAQESQENIQGLVKKENSNKKSAQEIPSSALNLEILESNRIQNEEKNDVQNLKLIDKNQTVSSSDSSVNSDINLDCLVNDQNENENQGVGSTILNNGSLVFNFKNSGQKSPLKKGEKQNHKDLIYYLKKHIKPLSFLIKKQASTKRPLGALANLEEDYIVSDDEETMEEFEKQMHQFIYEDEAEQEAQNLKIKEGVDEMGSLNFQYMMRRALLKDSNADLVRKLEIDYFQKSYGSFFNAFHQVKISPILQYESFLIYNFEKILRHKSIDTNFFFNVLTNMEANISKVILRKGSVAKFIFEDSQGNWVCLKEIKKKLYPCLLGKGPWNFYQTLFQPNELYVSKDFFVLSKNNKTQGIIYDFYTQFRTMSRCLERDHTFLSIKPEYSIFNFYSMMFENQKKETTVVDTLKGLIRAESQQKNREKRKRTVLYPPKEPAKHSSGDKLKEENQEITNGEYIKEQDQEQEQEQEQEDKSNKKQIQDFQVQIYGTKVMLMVLPFIGESEEDKILQKKKTENGKRLSTFGEIAQREEEIQQNRVETKKKEAHSFHNLDMSELNKKSTKEKEKINEQSTLPSAFIIEMMQSLKTVIENNQENLFYQFSSLINSLMRKDNYFNQIIEENIAEVELLKNRKEKILKNSNKDKNIFKKIKGAGEKKV